MAPPAVLRLLRQLFDIAIQAVVGGKVVAKVTLGVLLPSMGFLGEPIDARTGEMVSSCGESLLDLLPRSLAWPYNC